MNLKWVISGAILFAVVTIGFLAMGPTADDKNPTTKTRYQFLLEKKTLDQLRAAYEVEVAAINLNNALERLQLKCDLNYEHNVADAGFDRDAGHLLGVKSAPLSDVYEPYSVYLLDLDYEIEIAAMELRLAISNCESNFRSIDHKYQLLFGTGLDQPQESGAPQEILMKGKTLLSQYRVNVDRIYQQYVKTTLSFINTSLQRSR